MHFRNINPTRPAKFALMLTRDPTRPAGRPDPCPSLLHPRRADTLLPDVSSQLLLIDNMSLARRLWLVGSWICNMRWRVQWESTLRIVKGKQRVSK